MAGTPLKSAPWILAAQISSAVLSFSTKDFPEKPRQTDDSPPAGTVNFFVVNTGVGRKTILL